MLTIIEDGWCEGVAHLASTHYNERPDGVRPNLVVLHNISLPAGVFGTGNVEALFLGTLDLDRDASFVDLAGLRVSSHFLITRRGTVEQFVSCEKRAWHAGVSTFLGRDNCNDFSIGIEIEGTDTREFEDAQYDSLVELLGAISARYPIVAVVGHSDIAPGRKTDPGPHFDWVRLQREGKHFGSPDFPGAAASVARSLLLARAGSQV